MQHSSINSRGETCRCDYHRQEAGLDRMEARAERRVVDAAKATGRAY